MTITVLIHCPYVDFEGTLIHYSDIFQPTIAVKVSTLDIEGEQHLLVVGRDITPCFAERTRAKEVEILYAALIEAGVSVTLGTDNPVRLDTTIKKEYAAAAGLGLSRQQLVELTRNAIRSSFTTAERRAQLLAELAAIPA